MKEITVKELNELIQNKASYKLIDVREQFEADIAQIGGELIPLGEVPNRVEEFVSDAEKVIVHCRSGKRSADAIHYVEQKTGRTNLYNLVGGILAWSDEIDDSITKY